MSESRGRPNATANDSPLCIADAQLEFRAFCSKRLEVAGRLFVRAYLLAGLLFSVQIANLAEPAVRHPPQLLVTVCALAHDSLGIGGIQ